MNYYYYYVNGSFKRSEPKEGRTSRGANVTHAGGAATAQKSVSAILSVRIIHMSIAHTQQPIFCSLKPHATGRDHILYENLKKKKNQKPNFGLLASSLVFFFF